MKNVIITGATGMVGKSVLMECLKSRQISKILLISRRSIGINRTEKVQELMVNDFSELDNHQDQFKDYDACFHCMGVSVVGLSEQQYHKITYRLTKILVDNLYEANPNMIVNYVSGTGTDSSELGKVMWARVKGKTENYILNKGFSDTYMIRLGALLPENGIKSNVLWYNAVYMLLKPVFPILKKNKNFITTSIFGIAMINTLFYPQENKHLENKDLNLLASENQEIIEVIL